MILAHTYTHTSHAIQIKYSSINIDLYIYIISNGYIYIYHYPYPSLLIISSTTKPHLRNVGMVIETHSDFNILLSPCPYLNYSIECRITSIHYIIVNYNNTRHYYTGSDWLVDLKCIAIKHKTIILYKNTAGNDNKTSNEDKWKQNRHSNLHIDNILLRNTHMA